MVSSEGLEGLEAWPRPVALRRDGGIEAALRNDAAMNFTPKKKPAPAAKDKAKQVAPKATTGGGAKKPASEPTPSSKPSAKSSSKPSAKPSAAAKPSSR